MSKYEIECDWTEDINAEDCILSYRRGSEPFWEHFWIPEPGTTLVLLAKLPPEELSHKHLTA